jgi:endonuclease I
MYADYGTYYNGLDTSQNCNSFKTALTIWISNNDRHLNYGDIDSFYNKTDLKPAEFPFTGSIVVDRYCSEIPNGQDSCNFRYNNRTPGVRSFCFTGGTAAAYCLCYAKEHVFPSSWFDDTVLMRTDMHYVWPADSKTNNDKSNFPLGYVRPTPISMSYNGTKIGRSDAARNFGYIGAKDTLVASNNSTFNKVFEPIDSFKGDFARAYLYVATRYGDRIANWKNLDAIGSKVISNTSYTGLEPWILQLCVKWHKQDPPSVFEMKRNDSVFAIQGNRNPFIDYPEWVEKVFGPNGSASCLTTAIRTNKTVDFTIYPNPTNSVINIQFANSSSIDKNATIEVIDLVGKIILQQNVFFNNETKSLDVSNLSKGIYMISIKNEGQNNVTSFIKQ